MNFYTKQFKSFRETYTKSLLFVITIFLLFNTLSYMGIVNNPEEVVKAKETIVEMLGGMEKIKEAKETEKTTLIHYLKNNVGLLVIMFLAGFIPFYFATFILYLPTVLLLGVIMGISKIERGSAFVDVIITVGPHGITEFISIFTAAALSFYVSHTVTRKLFSKKRKNMSVRNTFLNAAVFFLEVSVPLMVISGIIETFVTPVVIEYYY